MYFSLRISSINYILYILLLLSGPREFCHNEAFIAECAADEVIVITAAMYGRMKLGRCVRTDFGFVGCYTDVMELVQRRCSGRRRCEIRIPDPIFDDTRPCNEDLKSYFETSYRCVKGMAVFLLFLCYTLIIKDK